MDERYVFRKSFFEKPTEYQIGKDGIVLKNQNVLDKMILFSRIKSIRFEYLPNNRYDLSNRYACTIETLNNQKYQILSTTYVSLANFQSQAETYIPFVKSLYKTVRKEQPNCIFYVGQSKSKYYGTIIFSVLMFVMAYFILAFLSLGGATVLFKFVLIGFYGIYLFKSIIRNRPKIIEDGQEIMESVLPDVEP